MRRSAAPLREREFRLLFAGRTIALVGNAIAPVALAFAVLDLTGSKTDLGLILFCREIPLVVFLLVGGIWADRIPRNKVMMSANVVSAFAQAVTAALLITGRARAATFEVDDLPPAVEVVEEGEALGASPPPANWMIDGPSGLLWLVWVGVTGLSSRRATTIGGGASTFCGTPR